MNPSQSIYELVGEYQIKKLTNYFYQEVFKNSKLRSLYPDELSPEENPLFLFLLQIFGGPQTYSEQRGHPRLEMRHFDWEIDESMHNHWLNSMFTAIDQLDLDPNIRKQMVGYFLKVAYHLINNE